MKRYQVCLEPLGVKIEVEEGTLLSDLLHRYGVDFPCGGNGRCGNCRVRLLRGEIVLTEAHRRLLQSKGCSAEEWRLACLSKVEGDMTIQLPLRENRILTDDSAPLSFSEEGYGIAVDVGSTTIVAQLVSLRTGQVMATCSELNGQARYGADIISRITYAIKGNDELQRLSDVLRNQIGEMVEKSRLEAGVAVADIRKVVLVGNTVMHHLFGKLNVEPLSMYPFQSEHNERLSYRADELGWGLSDRCLVVFLPTISHFVGSDILAGIASLQIHKRARWQALIDLGTNGEIVIGNRDQIICTSTAAGPAFEGINISCGMRAVSGAIYKVDAESGRAEVISDVAPCGVCGSGLIDAIDYFLRKNWIDIGGNICREGTNALPLTGDVGLLDRDIREFQLAKAAISSGFELLMRQLDIGAADIENIYISGGLGTYLDVEKAMNLGLLKAASAQQVCKAKNTALAGCKRLLYAQAQEELPGILALIRHFSLETSPDFQDVYCDHLFLGEV